MDIALDCIQKFIYFVCLFFQNDIVGLKKEMVSLQVFFCIN